MTITVSAFYKFVPVADCELLQRDLLAIATGLDIKGTILIAGEGINATIAGTDRDVRSLLTAIRSDPRFADLEDKTSYAREQPFGRLKVKIRREIVTFGVGAVDPQRGTGHYVEPEAWNELISEPGVIVVDTRNDYEFAIGTFAGAQNPNTNAFSEFPRYVATELAADKTRKVAMFCTGGIRCEKATAYLLSEGFSSVYHLKGGILKYLEVVPPERSLWQGECFVFDGRVALEHGVRQGHHGLCVRCGFPVPIVASAEYSSPACVACQSALQRGER